MLGGSPSLVVKVVNVEVTLKFVDKQRENLVAQTGLKQPINTSFYISSTFYLLCLRYSIISTIYFKKLVQLHAELSGCDDVNGGRE